jgi:hypothetical protein
VVLFSIGTCGPIWSRPALWMLLLLSSGEPFRRDRVERGNRSAAVVIDEIVAGFPEVVPDGSAVMISDGPA